MNEPLNFVPPRVAMVDPRTGLITREWYLFLQGLFYRVGGSNGPSTPDISNSLFEDAGSGETNSMLFALEQDYGQRPLPETARSIEDLTAEVSSLREQLAVLLTKLDDTNQSTLL
jgi:hypothetical protein